MSLAAIMTLPSGVPGTYLPKIQALWLHSTLTSLHGSPQVEKLLVEVEACSHQSLDARSALVERVAGEFSRLELYIQQGKVGCCAQQECIANVVAYESE